MDSPHLLRHISIVISNLTSDGICSFHERSTKGIHSIIEATTPAEPGELRSATFNGELVDAGHVRGGVLRNEHGVIRGCVTTGMTVQGRLFLDELQRKERDESRWGRFKVWGFPIIGAAVGYIVAIITPVITEWIKALLPAHHP